MQAFVMQHAYALSYLELKNVSAGCMHGFIFNQSVINTMQLDLPSYDLRNLALAQNWIFTKLGVCTCERLYN